MSESVVATAEPIESSSRGVATKRRRRRKPPVVPQNRKHRQHTYRVTTPPSQRTYLTRGELLQLVPVSMGTVSNLERQGLFPSRFRLPGVNRVCWVRSEVEAFLRKCTKDRVHLSPRPGTTTGTDA